MHLVDIVLQLTFGIVGGVAAAVMFPDKHLGKLGNIAAGLAGGLLGGQALTLLLGTEPGAIGMIQHAAGSGSGGAVLMIASGFVWSALTR